jgi:hypothetical protein
MICALERLTETITFLELVHMRRSLYILNSADSPATAKVTFMATSSSVNEKANER